MQGSLSSPVTSSAGPFLPTQSGRLWRWGGSCHCRWCLSSHYPLHPCRAFGTSPLLSTQPQLPRLEGESSQRAQSPVQSLLQPLSPQPSAVWLLTCSSCTLLSFLTPELPESPVSSVADTPSHTPCSLSPLHSGGTAGTAELLVFWLWGIFFVDFCLTHCCVYSLDQCWAHSRSSLNIE